MLRLVATWQHRLTIVTPKRWLIPRYLSNIHDSNSTKTIIDDTEVVGPGSSSPTRVATTFEQAAGLERIEHLGELAGRSAFLMDPLKIDKYGTLKEPIQVESVAGERIVGCTGFPKYSHETLWFWVKDGEVKRCFDCGQAFKINKLH